MNWRVALVVLAALGSGACQAEATEESDDASSDLSSTNDSPDGVPATFNKNHIVDDDFYVNSNYATAEQLKRFLQDTPHKAAKHSWLADARIGDLPAPEAIVRAAKAHNINPLMVLARMQVESSLVGKSEEPVGRAGQFALGCHKESAAYPNGLDPAVAPLDIQLECGAATLEKLFASASKRSNGFPINAPNPTPTLDKIDVNPDNIATSALYSYTPFVLEGKGGNWLVWNITKRYAAQFEAQNAGR